MITKPRLVALAVICVLALGGAVAYFVNARSTADAQVADAPAVSETNVESLLGADRVVFRSTALGNSYGKLSVVPLDDPGGARAVLDQSCERVYATATDGVCITADRGIVATYGITELNAQLQPQDEFRVDGPAQPGSDLPRRVTDLDNYVRHRSLLRGNLLRHRDDHQAKQRLQWSATSRTSPRPWTGSRSPLSTGTTGV